MNTTSVFLFTAIVPIIGFARNYYIEVIQRRGLWSAADNAPHEPEPNGILWPHLVLMFMWVIALLVQLCCHPAGIAEGMRRKSLRLSRAQQPLLEDSSQAGVAQGGDQYDGPMEHSPSLCGQYLADKENSLLANILPASAFSLEQLRKVHKWNGYFAVACCLVGITIATWLDGENNAAGKVITKSSQTGHAIVDWQSTLYNMTLWAAFKKNTKSIRGGKFDGFTIYTEVMWLVASVQMLLGCWMAYRLRQARTSKSQEEGAVCRSPAKSSQMERLLRLHKQYMLMGVVWISDPATHRIVFWARVLLIQFIYYPIMDFNGFSAYMWGSAGNYDLQVLWADPNGVGFVFSVGKIWVNLTNFILVSLYMLGQADLDDSQDSEGGWCRKLKLRHNPCSYGKKHPILVFNLVLVSAWFWGQLFVIVQTHMSAVPGDGQTKGIPPMIWVEMGMQVAIMVFAYFRLYFKCGSHSAERE